MRTTLNLAEDALLVAQNYARRQRVSLGEAVSSLIRSSTATASTPMSLAPLRGRYALAPQRDEIITTDHVRDLMSREGI
jgi:hypothetical protein